MSQNAVRTLKKLLRDKRAVSAVLSNLLLTVIAVALMSIATSATYVVTTNLRENMGERLIAEDVWFNSANSTVDIYLHNIGKTNIEVQAIYIDHVSQTFNGQYRLEINGNCWLHIPFEWKEGQTYYFDIVTSRGNHVASYYKAA